MSKTVSSILEIGVGIGLQFVPGGQAIGKQLILAGVATVASGLFQPRAPRAPQAESAIKTGIPVRVSAYGTARTCPVYWR